MHRDSLTGKRRIITLKLAVTLALVNAVMVITVFVRRMVKQRWFFRRDNSRLHWAQVLDSCVKSRLLPEQKPSPKSRIEMGAAEAVLLERWSHSQATTRSFLYALFRHWGILGFRLEQLRAGKSWEQTRSALILGRIGCRQAMADICGLLKRTSNVAFIQALEYLGDPCAIRPLKRM